CKRVFSVFSLLVLLGGVVAFLDVVFHVGMLAIVFVVELFVLLFVLGTFVFVGWFLFRVVLWRLSLSMSDGVVDAVMNSVLQGGQR
ncbi:hypothetical protein RA271_28885, partial [Pseudomonas syringae pv. tagetis]